MSCFVLVDWLIGKDGLPVPWLMEYMDMDNREFSSSSIQIGRQCVPTRHQVLDLEGTRTVGGGGAQA